MSQDPNKEYTAEQKARQEGDKLFYDMYKHMTTLNTGSILILVTFLEKFFSNPRWKALVAVAFVLFFFSIVTSWLLMGAHASFVSKMKIATGREAKFQAMCVAISIGGFLSGITLLIIFAIKNLYWQ